jgi:hypothetical protein
MLAKVIHWEGTSCLLKSSKQWFLASKSGDLPAGLPGDPAIQTKRMDNFLVPVGLQINKKNTGITKRQETLSIR